MGTLMILDDSAGIRQEMSRILREGGVFSRCLEAGDGAQGLKLLAEAHAAVDVIACDINMPVMDGLKFLRLAKADAALSRIPVLMVTTEAQTADVVRAFELGASDYIAKPFNPAILCARFKNMLRIKQLQDELLEQKEAMERMATTDPLTGLPNRRCFFTSVEEEFRRADRYGNPISLMMVDLDHFKRINDSYGHSHGDDILREMAQVMLSVVRDVDLVARYGGEEFVVILPQTDGSGGAQAAERLRQAIQAHSFGGLEGPGSLTASVGVAACRPGHGGTVQGLVDEADAALYRAKEAGRNRVEFSPFGGGPAPGGGGTRGRRGAPGEGKKGA